MKLGLKRVVLFEKNNKRGSCNHIDCRTITPYKCERCQDYCCFNHFKKRMKDYFMSPVFICDMCIEKYNKQLLKNKLQQIDFLNHSPCKPFSNDFTDFV
jgi:hypothetical protein